MVRLLIGLWLLVGCTQDARMAAARPSPEEELAGDIRRYVRALESKNGATCLDAVDYLPYFGAAAVPELLAALKGPSPNGRAFAAAALGRIADARAIPALIPLVDDAAAVELYVLSDDGERRHAAYDNPAVNVGQQAQIALSTITGRSLGSREGWERWWAEEQATFRARSAETRDPFAWPEQARWLKGVRICVDPGHGGDLHKQGYKRGPTYLSEAETNLRVARFLKDFLERAGAIVVMTRLSDRDVPLADRPRIAAEANCQLFVSIHHNWSPRLDVQGTTTWYHMNPDHNPASVDLARYVQEEVLRQVEPRDVPRSGGLMADTLMYQEGFAVLRQLPPEIPGCLVEMTYYSNLAMERRLRDLDFNRREAYGLFLGLAQYLYYGIPRAEIASIDPQRLELQAFDGLEGRGDSARAARVLGDSIIVRVDGARVKHEYDAATGRITVPGPFSSGDHSVRVDLVNIHKNHAWPKARTFRIP